MFGPVLCFVLRSQVLGSKGALVKVLDGERESGEVKEGCGSNLEQGTGELFLWPLGCSWYQSVPLWKGGFFQRERERTELCGNGEFVHCTHVCQACASENQPPLLRSLLLVCAHRCVERTYRGADAGCWAVGGRRRKSSV